LEETNLELKKRKSPAGNRRKLPEKNSPPLPEKRAKRPEKSRGFEKIWRRKKKGGIGKGEKKGGPKAFK